MKKVSLKEFKSQLNCYLEGLTDPKPLIYICREIYDILKSCSNGGGALQYIVENFGEVHEKSSESVEENSNDQDSEEKYNMIKEKEELIRLYGTLADGILYKLVYSNFKEDIFYNKLWEEISSNILFEDDRVRSFALYSCLMDELLPYYKLDGYEKITNIDKMEIFKKVGFKIRKAMFIRNRKFNSKFEQIFYFLKLLDEFQGIDEKIFVLAYILYSEDNNEDK